MTATMSQKAARTNIGTTSKFEGGSFITKNGVVKLFIQTVAEREEELNEIRMNRQADALLELVIASKQGDKMSLEDALSRMKTHAENTKDSFAEMLKVKYPEEEE